MRKLITFLIKYPFWTNTFIFLIVVGGLFTAFSIKKDRFPDTPEKEIRIDVAYPGASPNEVEEGITQKIEEALKGITGIDEYTSTSSENTASLLVITQKGYDVDELLQDVKNAVDRINSFPETAENPKVYKIKPQSTAMYLTLHGDVSPFSLKRKAEEIEDDFLASGLMSKIKVHGLPPLEISIEFKKEIMRKHQLTFEQIAQEIRKNNRDISGGILKTDKEDFLIRADLKETEAWKIGQIPIKADENGAYLLLEDLADIKFQFSEAPTKTLLNGKPALSIDVSIIPGEDLLKMADFLHQYHDTFNDKNDVFKLSINFDASVSVKSRLNLLLENGGVGLLLVIISLGLFLNLRLSFWVAMGIPVSLFAMLILANFLGVTINQISMFGMILVIGILVDDGIVIAENIHSKMERGIAPLKSAIDGTLEVLPAVFTSILTTVIAFSSLFFMDGRVGEFMSEMAIVVIIALLFSLVEATFVLPAHLNRTKGISKTHPVRTKINHAIDYLRINLYGKFLKFTLKYRWPFALLPILFFMVISYMNKYGVIKNGFFPQLDRNIINIDLEFKPGTPSDTTMHYLKHMENAVYAVNDGLKDTLGRDVVLSTKVRLGDGTLLNGHKGGIRIQILDVEERNFNGKDLRSQEIAKLIRQQAGPIYKAQKSTVEVRGWFGKALSYYLVSKSHDDLESAKNELMTALKSDIRVTNIIDDDVKGMKEIELHVKPKAKFLGLSSADIAQQIRNGYFGLEAQRLQIGTDEVKVWVRYDKKDRNQLEDLKYTKIVSTSGGEYPLQELADFSIERDQISINHYNGAREILITGDMSDPEAPSKDIVDDITANTLQPVLDKYPSVRKISGGQEKQNQKLMKSIFNIIWVIVILVYAIIALTFRSLFQPILIILMIPVGIYGGMFGHYVHGLPFLIMSTFGSVAVAGVVINDAVVFLDKFNRNIKDGMTVNAAVYDAGISRFRAILLTSITTVLGLYPLIMQKSLQAQFLIPMAIEVAFGVLVGTLFILLCFPAMIYSYNDLRRGFIWLWRGTKPSAEEVEPAYREEQRIQKLREVNDDESI